MHNLITHNLINEYYHSKRLHSSGHKLMFFTTQSRFKRIVDQQQH